jgi:hypothetical protein
VHAVLHLPNRVEPRHRLRPAEEARHAHAPVASDHGHRVEQGRRADQVEHRIDAGGTVDQKPPPEVRRLQREGGAQDLDAGGPFRPAAGRDHLRSGAHRKIDRRQAERGGSAADHQRLALLQGQIGVQAGPGRGVRLRDGRQRLPGQAPRLDGDDVGGRRVDLLGIAAVQGTAEAAHERKDGLAGAERALRVLDDLADAFYAADLGDVAPGAGAEVGLCVVEAERLDRDPHHAGLRRRIGALGQREGLWPAIGGDDDGFHGQPPVAGVRKACHRKAR